MRKIRTVMFDLGGVIMTLDPQEAIRRFKALGLEDAERQLDSYCQKGIFGDLENGLISAETFQQEISKMIGRSVSFEECRHAWLGYMKELPERNIQLLKTLKAKGYRLLLLSNTNPFMTSWMKTTPLLDLMDKCYLSYEMKMMKPNELVFRHVLTEEKSFPYEILFLDDGPRNVAAASQLGMATICPENGEDWTAKVLERLNIED